MLTAKQAAFWKPYLDALPDRSQFSIDGSDGGIGHVRSPFYTGWDVSKAEGGEGTVTVLINRIKYVQAELERSDLTKSDIMRVIMQISAQNYHTWLDLLLTRYAHCLSDQEHWKILTDCWKMQKSDELNAADTWRKLFAMRPTMPWLTAELPDLLPEEFTVYRAGHATGMSWSLDRDVAEWFDTRTQKLGGTSEMHERRIKRGDVLFYTNDRQEQEIVLLS